MDTVNKIKNKSQEYNKNKSSGHTRFVSTFEINDFVIDVSGLSNEHQAAFDIQIAISAYCRVVEKRIVDQVSQLCYYWFITQCALVLDSKLNSAFTSANLLELMREPFDQQQKRENLKKTFKDVPEQYLGSEQLVKRLALIQQERIRSTLPSIIDELKKEIKLKKSELKQMPSPITSEMDCWALYTDLIKKYREIINARVHGIYDNEMQLEIKEATHIKFYPSQALIRAQMSNDQNDERIAFQLYNRQKKCREKLHNSFKNFFTSEYQKLVLKLLEENAGVALPNFPSFILIKILNQVFIEETNYKYQLIHKLTDIILRTIDESEEKCSNDIKKMLEIEERVFTLNHYYMDTVNKIKNKSQEYNNSIKLSGNTRVSSTFSINDLVIDVSGLSNEHQATLDIQIAISAYCRVVEKRIVDQVSQLCYYWFITQCAL
ncbi:unnamed protein product, partial [Rotaria sordida]